MEGDSTNGFDMAQYKYEGAKILTDVMPDYWQGRARVAIHESDDVPESIEEKAIVKANKLADKKGVTPERAANALISKLAEKQNE